MSFVSYAQNYEDVLLWRALKNIESGFYIDVGANDPDNDSVTRAFYDRGWHGINIEPLHSHYLDLARKRERDVNLECAVGAEDGELNIWACEVRGWATLDANVAEEHENNGHTGIWRRIKVRTLTNVCTELAPENIHFLKIDVEGFEKSVLSGMDFLRFRPWIVLVEAIKPNSRIEDHASWEELLLQSDYTFVYADGLNRFYLSKEHGELLHHFQYPPNVFDNFVRFAQYNAEQQVQQAEQQVQQAEKIAADWAHQSEKLQDQLLVMINSRSWRITKPLRAVKRIVEGDFSPAERFAGGVTTHLKKPLLRVAARGFRMISRYPRLRKKIAAALKNIPWLSDRLVRIVRTAEFECVAYGEKDEILSVLDTTSLSRHIQEECFVLPLKKGRRTLYMYVDHTVTCSTNTGMQRVVRNLAAAMIGAGERIRFVKWHEASDQCVLITLAEREHLAKWSGPKVLDDERQIYSASGAPLTPIGQAARAENNWLLIPEVPYITKHAEPVTLALLGWARKAGLSSGAIFYDAIPLRRKEFIKIAACHAQYMQHLFLADIVWPISRWSSDDLQSYWISQQSSDAETLPELRPLSLPGEVASCERVRDINEGTAMVLSVGTIEPRKNQLKLIYAFKRYRENNPGSSWRLVLVGNLHPLVADELKQAQKNCDFIEHRGHVSEDELETLYRDCAFTVFPSEEEGFGLPILESLWYGKPCVCADFGAMAEVAVGGGCLMVNTTSEHALTEAIARLIDDSVFRRSLANECIIRSISTWEDYASAISNHIELEGNPATSLDCVYYWIDATIQFSKNTGIQRVSRQLARGLLDQGVPLVPVKWNTSIGGFGPVSQAELEYFSQWNGPPVEGWQEWREPGAKQQSWFFMPDLPLNLSAQERTDLLLFARQNGLKCAAVFYDAIPWKMRDIYPEHFAQTHREYMLELDQYDLVLPISVFSRHDLIDFLGASLNRPQGLDAKVVAAVLPGEFAESPRITTVQECNESDVMILCVGTVEPRKNHETLLQAFELATQRSRKSIRLVIVGGGHSIEPALADRVRNFVATRQNIIWEEDADDARLKALHEQCDFTVYPSLEEGFGLPILESLWYGKPVVCADFGAMQEVAEGGGCLTINVRAPEALANALVTVANDAECYQKLAREAVTRPFKLWTEYATEVACRLAQKTHVPLNTVMLPEFDVLQRTKAMHLTSQPILSVCVSTYNRAEWLRASLKNWARLYPESLPGVEFLVCDNTSTDHTPDVVEEYSTRADFTYHRNLKNVGMLGNLRQTAHLARGRYVWILGDDDLLVRGSVERVLTAINSNPDVALVYLNYAFTRISDARTVKDFDTFLQEATPIVPAEADRVGAIRDICARNENFFTAIYTLVFRRDHALRAYSQDTSGRPFSTMLTCIPTTAYVLNHMMGEKGVWVGTPQLVVNMNVSWMKYAPLWILERIPEVYELAEGYGASHDDVDRWRRHTLPSAVHYFGEILTNDPTNNAKYFSPKRFVRRFKHLPEFAPYISRLKQTYLKAQAEGHPAAADPVTRVFGH